MSIRNLKDIPDGSSYDVIIAGAGVAGMASALFAAIEQKKVLLFERTEYLGGTSALSGATVWVPNTHHSKTVFDSDSAENAKLFLNNSVGNYSSEILRNAFLSAGPKAIDVLERNSDVIFRPYATHPDYEQQHDGATMRGRALEPVPFDGRLLRENLSYLRPPIPEFTIFGGMMVDRTDIGHLLNLRKSRKSFMHAVKILTRYGLDRIKGKKRGTRLVMGNALVGRFFKSLLDRDVDIIVSSEIDGINTKDKNVDSVTVSCKGITRNLIVKNALVLSAGGFGRHPLRRADMLHVPYPEYSPAGPGHTGFMQDLAIKLGAQFGSGGADNAYWAPVSVRKRADGSTAVFPHFVMDRSKPGTVCVNQMGQRFVNESTSYHNFARAMFEAHKLSPTIPCYIVCDAQALKKYGLGMVRMGTKDVSNFLQDGYLIIGNTVADLAKKLDVPADNLQSTIDAMNAYAIEGIDREFGRGTSAYHRVNGDASAGFPNPTLGPIDTAPFYAIRLFPGDIGAATGLEIDAEARVLDGDKQPIKKLYACGAEAHSIMGGTYPGPGITLGPGIVFAYLAIQNAVHCADTE